MALRLWLPLNGNFQNNGLSPASPNPGSTAYSFVSGKIGNCVKTTSTTYIDTQLSYDYWNFGSNSVSMCGWFKFNKAEINAVLTGKTYTEAACTATTNLIGFNNYGGFALCTKTNNMYNSGKVFNNLYAFGNMRTSAGSWNTGDYTIPFDTWVHIALVFNKPAGTMELYVNGNLFNTKTSIPSFDDTSYTHSNFRINSGTIWGGNGPGTSIPFCANDVRVYDHALSLKEIKEISQGLILHYKLDKDIVPNTNLILESHKVTGGSDATGIISTYMPDGTLKIEVSAGNGNYRSCNFAKNSNGSVGAGLSVGDTYTISVDILVESGTTTLPQLFINSGNSYKRLQPVNGAITIGKWTRAYYTSTWAAPGTSYGNIALHLGFSSLVGVFYVKNFKLEKSDKPTPWCPNPADALWHTLGYDVTIVNDCSGYENNGTTFIGGSLNIVSSTPRYDKATYMTSDTSVHTIASATYIKGVLNNEINPDSFTISFWLNLEYWGRQNSGIFSIDTKNASSPSSYTSALVNQYDSVFRFNSSGSTAINISATNLITNNSWHHYAFSFDGMTIKAYKDGVLSSSGAYSTAKTMGACGSIWLGLSNAGGTARKSTGSWGDFRIYATALSAEDVLDLYHTPTTIDKIGNLHCFELNDVDAQNKISVKKNGIFLTTETDEGYDKTSFTKTGGLKTNEIIEK